ncbi:MAG: hypothetical protein KBA71_09205 [Opitutaceae bacterium]|nr:hypothetical protein [Opitutaceae bacterium]
MSDLAFHSKQHTGLFSMSRLLLGMAALFGVAATRAQTWLPAAHRFQQTYNNGLIGNYGIQFQRVITWNEGTTDPAKRAWVITGQDENGVRVSYDYGATWTSPRLSGLFCSKMARLYLNTDEDLFVALGGMHSMPNWWRTVDCGVIWTNISGNAPRTLWAGVVHPLTGDLIGFGSMGEHILPAPAGYPDIPNKNPLTNQMNAWFAAVPKAPIIPATGGVASGTAAVQPALLTGITAGGTVEFLRRAGTGGGTSQDVMHGAAAPRFVKLVRIGSLISAYHSSDGGIWTQIGPTMTIPMRGSVLAGVAGCSIVNSPNLYRSTFEGVYVR